MTSKTHFAMLPAAAILMAGAAYGEMRISQSDVNEMKYKVEMAAKFFQATWRDVFSQAGKSFPAPKMVPYQSPMQTACGPTKPGNAGYCPTDNTIYYDVLFLTEEMKETAAARHTDGDYAPIVILAHEMGHGIGHLLNAHNFVLTYTGERLADCLAGVVTWHAKRAGNLDAGDLEEGLYELGRGGDGPNTSILTKGAHGPAKARMEAFMLGYNSGITACDAGIGKALAKVQTQAPATQPVYKPYNAPSSPVISGFPGGWPSNVRR